MNQICKVCGEPAAGFHFGAFTCEGCKSFFGRSYNNLSSISECKNNGKCIIDKKNRTTCKACRLRKCYTVGMSKGGSRYGRRSNWFKIHCLLQEQQQQAAEAAGNSATNGGLSSGSGGFGDMAAAAAAAVAQQHMQRNSHFAAAQHMGGFLGYHGFLPEMMQTCSPFVTASASERRSAEAANSNTIPFMNMMNSLPIAPPQHNFHLPTHLIFPGYHNTVSNATTTPVCHTEMFKHRQSVESVASGDSIQRYSPAMRSRSSASTDDDRLSSVTSQSPELCVAEEEIPTPLKHTIHTPIAVRAIPKDNNDDALPFQQASLEKCAKQSQISPRQSERITVIPTEIQSQSTVLDASKTRDSDDILIQDTPIDLSMKAVRSSPDNNNSHYAIPGSNDDTQATISDSSDDDLYQTHTDMRRKFCQFNSEQESNSASESSSHEGIKRQRLTPTNFNSFTHNAPVTSLRGIFVCV